MLEGVFAVEEAPIGVREQPERETIRIRIKVVMDNFDSIFMEFSFESRKKVRCDGFYLFLISPKTDIDILNW